MTEGRSEADWQALEARVTRLEVAQRLAGLVAFELDPTGELIAPSPAMATMYGLPPDQPVTTAALLARMDPSDRDRIRSRRISAIEADGPIAERFRVHAPDGTIRTLFIGSRPSPSRPGHRIGYIQDLTAQLELETRISDLERLWQSARRLANLGSFAYDVRSRELSLSAEVGEMLGDGLPLTRTAEDPLGWVHPADREGLREDWQALTAGGPPMIRQVRIERPGGEIRHYRCWYQALRDDAGEATHLIGTMLDITEKVRAREALEVANAELREADRQKDAFLSLVSHELRNPLGTIMGYANLLTEEVRGPLNPEQHHFVEAVDRAALRLARLVDDLLDVAQVQSSTFRVHPIPQQAAPLIEEVVATMRGRFEDTGVALEVGPLPPVRLPLDPDRFQQVLTNLLENARKFSPAGGRVEVVARLGPDALRLDVRDDGPGIAPADQARIFERFQQAAAGVDAGRGVGLGLAIVRAIVEGHGGRLGVVSAPGEGSTFWAEWPLGGATEG